MIRLTLTFAALAVSGAALAKLPAPVLDDAAKAKAAETTAKTAWQGKQDAYLLCKAQDKAVAAYKKGPAANKAVAVNAADAKPVAATPSSSANPTTAAQGGGTPVPTVAAAPTPIPPCADPGPFAYAPPEQKPLETSGAHSPAANATSPPSNRATSAEMAPAKPATAQSKKP